MRLDSLSFSFSFARFFYISAEAVFKSFWLFVLVKPVFKPARAANRHLLELRRQTRRQGTLQYMI